MKTRTKALVAAIPILFLAAACGAGALSQSAAEDTGGSSSAKEPAAENLKSAVGRRTTDTGAKSVVGPLSRAVISSGRLTLRTDDLARARAEMLRLVASWQGLVADEQSSSDERGRLRESTLTLRVPSEHFDEAITALAALGKVEHQSRSSDDVTTEVIDNDARVRAAERSIRQIERLLDRATKLSDIIAIESDLARRQADLDSLKSQQAWLADQTSLSTITVQLSQRAQAVQDDDARGFLAGLGAGWTALTAGTVVLLTILGAVLPFLALAALVGVPLWVVVRRRRLARVPA